MTMLGRDESMPNRADPELSTVERRAARAHAANMIIAGARVYGAADLLLARAVMRYVPAEPPAAVPTFVAGANDRTMQAGLIGAPLDAVEPVEDIASGVCEVSEDGPTGHVGRLGLTTMLDLNDATRR